MLVSIVVAAYNHARFIEAALRSLVSQTHGELELIAIDDGSDDGTYATMQALRPELEARFSRVEMWTKRNEGSAATLVQGLALASADLVYILDSDDVALPQAVEQLLPLMTEGVALAVGDNEYVDEHGRPTAVERDATRFHSLLLSYTAHREDFASHCHFGSYSSLIGGNYVPNGWLLRRSLARRVGGFLTGDLVDDWSLLLRLAKHYRIVHTDEVLAQYRVHDGNVTRTAHESLLLDTLRILARERGYCVEHGLTPQWRKHASRVVSDLAPRFSDPRFLATLAREPNAALTDVLTTVLQPLVEPGAPDRAAPQWSGRTSSTGRCAPPDGSHGQRIHLYATCCDDAAMLPFFFRHYDPYVQRYVIYDDGSSDGSVEILQSHPRVELRRFEWTHPESFVLSELDHYDNAWKECRGAADWVMVLDLDEHLYHASLGPYLARCLALGVTTIPAIGFEMATEEFPSSDELLCRTRTTGVPDAVMSKLSLFAPGAIEEMRYSPGAHRAAPVGRVLTPAHDELMLLHYKLLGDTYPARRQAALAARRGSVDVAHGWGHHWTDSKAALRDVRHRILADGGSVNEYTAPPSPADYWWHAFPRVEDLFERIGTIEMAHDAVQARADAFRQEVDQCSAERGRLKQDVDTLAARVRALESSKTWRWTAGLRNLVDRVTRLSGR